MPLRWSAFAVMVGVLALSACDDRPAERPAPAAATRAADVRRISLGSVPFSVDAPDGWDVRAGPGGALALNGQTPNGTEIDVLLAAREPIAADAVAELLKRVAPTTATSSVAADAGLLTRHVEERDGMIVLEETGRPGPADQAADLAPYRWTIRYLIVGGSLRYPVYEFTVANLSQISYERSRDFLRPILRSVRYDPASTSNAR